MLLSFLSLLVLPAVYASHHAALHYYRKRATDAHTGDNEFSFYDTGV
jgi:hypothetical protein